MFKLYWLKINFNYTYSRTIRAKYLRIMLSSFGEEDIQKFALYIQIVFGYYFTDNATGPIV